MNQIGGPQMDGRRRNVNAFLGIVLGMTLSSCAFAPWATTTSGRSLGKGKAEVQAGYVPGGGHGRFSAGITEDIDVGAHMEFHLFGGLGAHAKWSLLNQSKGPSFAMIGGAGIGLFKESYYYFVGPSLSSKWGFFEPYATLRLNGVYWPKAFQGTGISIENDNIHFTYLQTSVGAFFWITDSFGVILEGSWFGNTSEKVKLSGNTVAAMLALRF